MTSVDWQQAHDRLERTRRSLEGVEPSTDAARRILEARAEALAQPLATPASAETRELMVFTRGEASYAVDPALVLEVIPLADPTPVPGTPAAVVGVVNHRGRILPVVDVARLFWSQAPDAAEAGLVVAVASGDAALGIRADAVLGVLELEEHEAAPAGRPGEQHDGVIRGVTSEMVSILDVEALARDPRIVVDDEVE